MQPIRSANDTEEFRKGYGANEFVNALYALDKGWRGQGVTVGVIDDGVVNAKGELDGRIDTARSKDFGYVTTNGVRTKRDVLGDNMSRHGTQVANVIAANANGVGGVGYAPEAKIAVLRITDLDTTTGVRSLSYDNLLAAIDFATANGIKILNHSLSSGGERPFQAALERYSAAGGLFVTSAGNSSKADPADAAVVTNANRASIIFVGSLSGNIKEYQIEAYSHRAGSMKDRFVVAPGSNYVLDVDGGPNMFGGTSSAAPVVAALAATILSKWPQLTGVQTGEIILNTARDIGAPGVDEVYGRGLVDFQAALSPINPKLNNGSTQTSIDSSVMVAPSSFGIGSIQTALSNVTVLDEYGRDFSGSVAEMVVRPEVKQGHWLRRRIEQMAPGGGTTISAGPFSASLGFVTQRVGPREGEVRSAVAAGHVGYVSGRTGVRAAWNGQDSLQTDVMGLAPFSNGILAYAPQAGNSVGIDRYIGNSKFGLTVSAGRDGYVGSSAHAVTLAWSRGRTDLRLSYVDERGSIMGTPTGLGALRLGRGATTAMIEGHRTFSIGDGWTLEGYGSIGFTKLKIDTASLVTGSSAIIGSRVGLQAHGQMLRGVVSFGIAQPLTIEAGSARLTYGTGYDLETQSLTYSTANASLAGQRRLQLTTGYSTGGYRSTFRVGAMRDVNLGATTALVGWNVRY